MLYSSLILPYLNYGILAWGNTYSSYLERILLLQKKALRIICRESWRCHTNDLFYQNNILKIKDLYCLNLGQFMYKLINNSLPFAFDSMFIQNKTVHSYPTRQINEFHLPRSRTVLAKSIFSFAGPKFWNSLDSSIKESLSFNTFTLKLKKMFINSYITGDLHFESC